MREAPGRLAHGPVRVDPATGPRGVVDWTLRDEHGTTLRWRQWPGARPVRMTLVDADGGAWSIARRSRTAWRAELPEKLSETATLALLLVVEHQIVERVNAGLFVAPSHSAG